MSSLENAGSSRMQGPSSRHPPKNLRCLASRGSCAKQRGCQQRSGRRRQRRGSAAAALAEAIYGQGRGRCPTRESNPALSSSLLAPPIKCHPMHVLDHARVLPFALWVSGHVQVSAAYERTLRLAEVGKTGLIRQARFWKAQSMELAADLTSMKANPAGGSCALG